MAKDKEEKEKVELTNADKDMLLRGLGMYEGELKGLVKKCEGLSVQKSVVGVCDKLKQIEELKNKLL